MSVPVPELQLLSGVDGGEGDDRLDAVVVEQVRREEEQRLRVGQRSS